MSGSTAAAPDDVPDETGDDQGEPSRERSPRRGMCSAVLFLEAITIALATPVMITVYDVGPGLAVTTGLGLGLVCVLLSGMLRAEWAYRAGWVVQALAFAMGFLVSFMFFLGALFGLLWGMAYGLGLKIERERAAAWAAWEAQQGSSGGQ